jgi:NAD(P)-dependent dehydrogenase (short-subunit alcohol dehydrogenase family)
MKDWRNDTRRVAACDGQTSRLNPAGKMQLSGKSNPQRLWAEMATPEEVAQTILFLASDSSLFLTGAEFVIDGGYTAQ